MPSESGLLRLRERTPRPMLAAKTASSNSSRCLSTNALLRLNDRVKPPSEPLMDRLGCVALPPVSFRIAGIRRLTNSLARSSDPIRRWNIRVDKSSSYDASSSGSGIANSAARSRSPARLNSLIKIFRSINWLDAVCRDVVCVLPLFLLNRSTKISKRSAERGSPTPTGTIAMRCTPKAPSHRRPLRFPQ